MARVCNYGQGVQQRPGASTTHSRPYLAASAAGSAAMTSPTPPALDHGATSVETNTT